MTGEEAGANQSDKGRRGAEADPLDSDVPAIRVTADGVGQSLSVQLELASVKMSEIARAF